MRSLVTAYAEGNAELFWHGLRGRNTGDNSNLLQQGITYLMVAIRTSERFTSLDDLKISAICQSKGKTLGVNGIFNWR